MKWTQEAIEREVDRLVLHGWSGTLLAVLTAKRIRDDLQHGEALQAVKQIAMGSMYDVNDPRNKRRLEQVNNPRWEETGFVHDWRNYIPEEIMPLWDELPEVARWCMWIMADKQADQEE